MESKGEAEILKNIRRTIDSIENNGVILSSSTRESIYSHNYSCKGKWYLSEWGLYVQSSSISSFGSRCLQPELKDDYLVKRISAYEAL